MIHKQAVYSFKLMGCGNQPNGLLLSPHIDKLFDRGWITFTDAGDLLCAEPGIEQALQQWGIELPKNVRPFNTKQAAYLAYHRDEIFRAEPALSA